MEQLNKTPTQGKFGDVAKVLDTNFGLIVAKLIELEAATKEEDKKDLYCGFYGSEDDLKAAVPTPERGMVAYVAGDDEYTYIIYRCKKDGEWTATDKTFKINLSTDFTNFATKEVVQALSDKVDDLMLGAVYGGLVDRTFTPGTPKTKIFYMPTEAGDYANFGGLSVVANEVAFLYWDGTQWSKHSVDFSLVINELQNATNDAKTTASNALSKAEAAAKVANTNTTDISKLKTDVKDVTDKVGGMVIPKIACMTQAAYDALPTKDPDTTYLTTEE